MENLIEIRLRYLPESTFNKLFFESGLRKTEKINLMSNDEFKKGIKNQNNLNYPVNNAIIPNYNVI